MIEILMIIAGIIALLVSLITAIFVGAFFYNEIKEGNIF